MFLAMNMIVIGLMLEKHLIVINLGHKAVTDLTILEEEIHMTDLGPTIETARCMMTRDDEKIEGMIQIITTVVRAITITITSLMTTDAMIERTGTIGMRTFLEKGAIPNDA